MRKILAAALAAALAGVLAASAMAATRTIRVGDNFFVRRGATPTITVAKGTRLRFRWTGKAVHNVRVTSGPRRFRSDFKSSGTFTRRVTRAGTYRLVCDVHPGDMKLTVRVR